MKEKITGSIIWNEASVAGLFLGVFSALIMLLKQLAGMPMIIHAILWAVEFFGCIMMMRHFMKKLASDYAGVTSADTFRYGRRIALFSAVIVAAASFAILLTIGKEAMAEAIDTLTESPLLDSNSRRMMEDMQDKMPVITFFTNLIYCYLYGTVLSKILSGGIPGDNPFDGDSADGDEEPDKQ